MLLSSFILGALAALRIVSCNHPISFKTMKKVRTAEHIFMKFDVQDCTFYPSTLILKGEVENITRTKYWLYFLLRVLVLVKSKHQPMKTYMEKGN